MTGVDLDEARGLWTPQPGWLNTASYGLPPATAWEALQEALEAWRCGRHSWEPWGEAVERARASYARLVGVATGDVAIGSTVSELVGLVAASLPDGARVIAPEVEFTSNLYPWLVQEQRGVDVVTVPTDRVLDSIDERTDVVTLSAVQSSTGEVADLAAVSAAARAVDALLVVDATQAVGWLPVDATVADAVITHSYKWLMTPRGAALGAFGQRLRDRVSPVYPGWYAAEYVHDSFYGPPLLLADDARRFDASPAWFSWVGAAPAFELVEQIGVAAIHDHDVGLANRFRAGLGLPASDSAIVSTNVDGAAERLAAAGIRAATRAGSLRVSFHVYNTEADVDAALDALAG
jgi:selenocysteine lyase/cysteine desulfurase